MYVYRCICLYVCTYLCMCVYICMYVYGCVCVCKNVCANYICIMFLCVKCFLFRYWSLNNISIEFSFRRLHFTARYFVPISPPFAITTYRHFLSQLNAICNHNLTPFVITTYMKHVAANIGQLLNPETLLHPLHAYLCSRTIMISVNKLHNHSYLQRHRCYLEVHSKPLSDHTCNQRPVSPSRSTCRMTVASQCLVTITQLRTDNCFVATGSLCLDSGIAKMY